MALKARTVQVQGYKYIERTRTVQLLIDFIERTRTVLLLVYYFSYHYKSKEMEQFERLTNKSSLFIQIL